MGSCPRGAVHDLKVIGRSLGADELGRGGAASAPARFTAHAHDQPDPEGDNHASDDRDMDPVVHLFEQEVQDHEQDDEDRKTYDTSLHTTFIHG